MHYISSAIALYSILIVIRKNAHMFIRRIYAGHALNEYEVKPSYNYALNNKYALGNEHFWKLNFYLSTKEQVFLKISRIPRRP